MANSKIKKRNIINNDSNLSYDATIYQQNNDNKEDIVYPKYEPQLSKSLTNEDLVIAHVKQFKPRWMERDGRKRLEGNENGNNANLAQYLRECGISNVETEMPLINGIRIDLLINNKIAIECKPNLLHVDKLHSVASELRRIKRLGQYEVYALIYGDAKSYLLEDLKADIGENSVIVLGDII
jgi:hypothetical protein